MLEVSNRAHLEDKAGGLEARSGHQPERHATGEVWARGSATSGSCGTRPRNLTYTQLEPNNFTGTKSEGK